MGAEFTTDVIKKSETVSLEVANNWPQVFWNLQSGRVGKQFTFTLQRNDAAGQPVKVKVEPTYDETWPFHQRGFELVTDQSIRQESTLGGAMFAGCSAPSRRSSNSI